MLAQHCADFLFRSSSWSGDVTRGSHPDPPISPLCGGPLFLSITPTGGVFVTPLSPTVPTATHSAQRQSWKRAQPTPRLSHDRPRTVCLAAYDDGSFLPRMPRHKLRPCAFPRRRGVESTSHPRLIVPFPRELVHRLFGDPALMRAQRMPWWRLRASRHCQTSARSGSAACAS